MQSPILLIGIAVVILIVLVVLAFSIRSSRKDDLETRLGQFTDGSTTGGFLEQAQEEAEKTKKKEKDQPFKKIDAALEKRGFGAGFKEQLSRADIKLTVVEYLLAHVAAMAGAFALVYFFLSPGNLVLGIIAGGIGLFAPRIFVSFKQSSRLRKFENQLPDVLGLWVNGLRAGFSNMQALDAISKEAAIPAGPEIRRVVQEVQFGIPPEQAFEHLLVRMPSEDLDLIITAVNIQREVGGNLAEILNVISDTIRERIKLKGEVRVLTAQGRITGYLISGLPIVLALFLMGVNPNYMGGLFTNRTCGWPMIGIGLGLIGLGSAIIQKIVDIEI